MKKDLTIIGKLVHPYLRLLFTIFCFSSLILVDSAAMAQADRETFEQSSAPVLTVIEGIENGINSSLSVNTNGIILESPCFKRRNKKPLAYIEKQQEPLAKKEKVSYLRKAIEHIYSYFLEKLKIKSENN